MMLLNIIYAVLFPIILGVCFVNIFLNNKDDAVAPERIAFGFCMGLMLITIEMLYVLSPLGIKFSVLTISVPLLPIVLYGGYISFKNRLLSFKLPKLASNYSTLEKIFIVLILIQILFVSTSLFIKPVSGWDAWQGYSYRAKAFYVQGTTNIPTLVYSVRGQHVALTQTWIFECLGKWHEIAGKINFSLYYIALLTIFFYAVNRFKDRSTALLFTYMLSSLPFLAYHATLEYCDIILAIYLFAAVALMYIWFNNPRINYLLLSFIFLLSTTTIKPEALFHIAIVFAVFTATIFSKKLEKADNIEVIKKTSLWIMIIGGIYLFLKVFIIPHESLIFSPSIKFSRLPALFSVFGDYMFNRNNWSIVWFLLILLSLLNFNKLKEKYNFTLLAIVILEVFGFMGYYFTQVDWIYDFLFYVTPAVRNMLQFMPIVIFLIANLITTEIIFLSRLPLPLPAEDEASLRLLK